jgi:hypothetical protein
MLQTSLRDMLRLPTKSILASLHIGTWPFWLHMFDGDMSVKESRVDKARGEQSETLPQVYRSRGCT